MPVTITTGTTSPTIVSAAGDDVSKPLTADGQVVHGAGIEAAELAFIDPGVPGLSVLLHELRPGVEAILLGRNVPAARQIAMAVAGRSDVAAIHVLAHGAPGRVSFSAGEWTAASLAADVEDLAAIGCALLPGGELRLWSCRAGAGIVGEAFVAGLAEATGATIAAAEGLVGAAARGGSWELARVPAAARSPLTAAGIAAYQDLLVTKTYNAGSGTWNTPSNWTPIGVPANGDDVVLVGNGNITITLDVNTANLNSVAFNSTNNLVFAIGTFTLTVTRTSSGAITIGTTGTQEITIAGGTINDSGGLAIDPGSSLSGFGTLNIAGSITGLGTLQASGGLLDVFGTIASGVVLSIDSTAGSDLRIDGSVISAAALPSTTPHKTWRSAPAAV